MLFKSERGGGPQINLRPRQLDRLQPGLQGRQVCVWGGGGKRRRRRLRVGAPADRQRRRGERKTSSRLACSLALVAIGTLLHFRRHVPSWSPVAAFAVGAAAVRPRPPVHRTRGRDEGPAAAAAAASSDAAAVLCKKVAKTLALWPLARRITRSLAALAFISRARARLFKARKDTLYSVSFNIYTEQMGQKVGRARGREINTYRIH